MKKLLVLFGIILLSISLNSCHKENPVENYYDKQIRFQFNLASHTYNSGSANFEEILSGESISKFNIGNYVGVDSVIFTAVLDCWDSTKYFGVDLFDLTDSLPINNSLVKVTNTTHSPDYFSTIYVETGNIYRFLPQKEINLAMRMRNLDVGDYRGTLISACLYLYRK